MEFLILQIMSLLETINSTLGALAGFVWTGPVVYLCLIAGLFFTVRLAFIQFKCFPHAIALIMGKYDNPNEKGQITHFQALSAALSGTIGLGNIAGVAIAIGLGGPGAVLWMWIIGLFGMATKYVECALGTHYREEFPDKTVSGGPMYYILNGLGKKWNWMAVMYSICIMFAAIGAACLFQSNQAASVLNTYYNLPNIVTGIALMTVSFIVIIGGINRIGKVASKIVPFMCFIYLAGALIICILNIDKIPDVFRIIFVDAFTGKAVASGSLFHVFMWGVRRAVFSNEAGLGSAAIAHAAVKTDYPIREGMVASLGPLIDTIVVCTATAAVIILGGNFGTEKYIPFSNTSGQTGFEMNFEEETNNPHIVRSAHHPKNTERLRQFISGKYTNKITQSNPLKIEINTDHLYQKDKQKGLRFSYYLHTQPIEVSGWIDDKEIATFEINTERAEAKGTSNKALTIETSPNANNWNSAVLSLEPHPEYKNKQLTLTIRPSTKEGTFVDRFETVEDVKGIELTALSFDKFIKGFGSIFIPIAVMLFAFSTIITWCYYGETACGFLSNKKESKNKSKAVFIFKLTFVGMILVGAVIPLETVINFSDLMLGLVVVPNFIAIALLSGQVHKWTKNYYQKLKAGDIVKYK